MRFAKGHGTGNDFLIIPDPDGRLTLPPHLVARLCDRHTGLGADGILRAVHNGAAGHAPGFPAPGGHDRAGGHSEPGGLNEAGGHGEPGGHAEPAGLNEPGGHAEPGGLNEAGGHPEPGGHLAPGRPAAAVWFMDYRNADGSVAEMCGNGIRVFARYLLGHSLATGPELAVATRAGLRQVTEEPGGDLTVGMGTPEVLGRSAAVIGGSRYEGMEISLGNPHLACVVDQPVSGIDLSRPPLVDEKRFPDGANVEVVRVLGAGCLEMRVYERGSGATLSCGTGAVAAAVAAQAAVSGIRGGSAAEPAAAWTVRVPGGELTVRLSDVASLLTGPAEIVAEGDVDETWLAGLAAAGASSMP